MRILLVADGRSVITRRWIDGLLALGYEVCLISTFPCHPLDGVKLAGILPVAFSALSGSQVKITGRKENRPAHKSPLTLLRPFLQIARYYLGPLTLPLYAAQFRQMIENAQPDLVHALRIPFEGMLASYLPDGLKLVISTWGNDLTLHARGSWLMAHYTHRALQRADALMSDTQRDIQLAKKWGLDLASPVLLLPGNGGIDLQEIERIHARLASPPDYLPADGPLIINPRGFRPGSVHQETFFQAIPLVLREFPSAQFVCTAMQGQVEAQNWVKKLGIEENVTLLPYLEQAALWDLFMRSQVYVSLSSHDGTPNTLLEAMACSAFPVCGDIDSIREWITNGENGFLVDPLDQEKAAMAIITALQNKQLRNKAASQNKKIIKKRAALAFVRRQMDQFYKQLLR